ncbi:MAG: LysM peptidoglycan-binding domain-containing protein [Jiangellaceae bacterium]
MITMTPDRDVVTAVRVVIRPGPLAHFGDCPATGRRIQRVVTGLPVALPCDRSAAPGLHGSRLTRRGRLVVTMIWLVLAVAAVGAVARAQGGTDPRPSGVTVEVRPGDTLWHLAARIAPHADVRETVAAIVEINELASGADIRPGDTLRLPVVP